MIDVSISSHLLNILNNCRLGILLSNVQVYPSGESYLNWLADQYAHTSNYLIDNHEKSLDIIQETRAAYKACGKEPSRYRPSAEALLKRLRTKKELYYINNVVDTINYLSIKTHYSIGGFDFQRIDMPIACDIGDSAPYEAIGRGDLNIAKMPGMKDKQGFFGTPTSDSTRTMVRDETNKLLIVFYDFYGNASLENALELAGEMLTAHCGGEVQEKTIIS